MSDEFRLRRYTIDDTYFGEYEDSNGQWVRWADVENLLKAYLILLDKHRAIQGILSNTLTI